MFVSVADNRCRSLVCGEIVHFRPFNINADDHIANGEDDSYRPPGFFKSFRTTICLRKNSISETIFSNKSKKTSRVSCFAYFNFLMFFSKGLRNFFRLPTVLPRAASVQCPGNILETSRIFQGMSRKYLRDVRKVPPEMFQENSRKNPRMSYEFPLVSLWFCHITLT